MDASVAIITSSMLKPLSDAFSANVEVALPIGLGIMAIMLGISVIPRIIYKFF